MQKRKKTLFLILLSIVFVGIAFFVSKSLLKKPDYGVKSRWKRIVLNQLLTKEVPKISVDEAYKKRKQAIFIDSRSIDEYTVSHIDGARFIASDNFSVSLVEDIEKDQSVIIYCSIGKRSDAVAEKMLEAGFTNVSNLYGGIFEWVNQKYPVLNKQNLPTDSVHAFNRLWGLFLHEGKKVY